jgi:hypothetical protein
MSPFPAGALAVGKTSALVSLASMRPDWIVAAEPLKEWESFKVDEGPPVNLLKAFYDQPTADSFRRLQVR